MVDERKQSRARRLPQRVEDHDEVLEELRRVDQEEKWVALQGADRIDCET
jgi:hypothetical protein